MQRKLCDMAFEMAFVRLRQLTTSENKISLAPEQGEAAEACVRGQDSGRLGVKQTRPGQAEDSFNQHAICNKAVSSSVLVQSL